MSPADQTAEVEVVDSTTEPGATWAAKATFAMGGKPKVTLRRAMKF